MSFRTKHFVLILGAAAILLSALVYFWTKDVSLSGGDNTAGIFFSLAEQTEEVTYAAEVNVSGLNDRSARLAELRNKIASTFVPKLEENVLVEDILDETESFALETGEIFLCNNFQTFSGAWNPKGLTFEVVEGARLLLRNEVVILNAAQRTVDDVVLQLPIRSVLLQSERNCLPSDVVAIALDGSLIKTADYSLYSIFGHETLIGYTLDGFGLYGLNLETKVDSCGGSIVEGEYRYYLSKERQGVISCFSSGAISI